MPAPDLGPAPAHVITERPLAVHLLPALVAPEALAGGVVIMIDALRASVTISAALAAGATRVVPTLTVEDAERLRGPGRLLGGERGGVLIPGFDLDNSPRAYTSERVRGKEIVFTTVNGTAALLHAGRAHEVLIGAVTNVSAIVARVAHEPRAVHILCAGTRGEITMDDCLAAGLIAERLIAAGRQVVSDDSTRMCVGLARLAAAHPSGLGAGVLELMRESRGGRGLTRLGFEGDLRLCSTLDAVPVVPVFAQSAITCGLPS